MINIVSKKSCCGCEGCKNICPQNCIIMKKDNEGFEYPKVDKLKCTSCGLCEKVCPTFNELIEETYDIEIYGCKNKDDLTRLSSSSGGIFILICENVINKNGVVFGAAFDIEFNVRHMFAETLEECEKFKGSKYVQSIIGNSFKEVKKFLDSDRIVLFSGTQCQIKGLNLFLRKKYEKLITVDVICHGVPSPLVFKKYREYLENKSASIIEDYKFKDKSMGWHNYSTVVKFEKNKKYNKLFQEDLYMKGFLSNLYLRPSCYECKAKNFTSGSDLSLADYWGIEKINPEFDDDKGCSLVLVNTSKAQHLLKNINGNMDNIQADLIDVIKYNPCIVKSVENNSKRHRFFKRLKGNDVINCIEKSFEVTFMDKVKNKINYEIKKLNL